MFVDFDEIFNEQPQTEIRIPDALLSYLSNQLPDGVKYIVNEDGNCVVASENGSYTLGGFFCEPTDAQKTVLGEKYTREDVLKYCYNAQQSIPLRLEKDNYVKLNGEYVPIDRLSYNPFKPIEFVYGEFYIGAPPFPKPFTIQVGCEKYTRTLTVSRIANESVNVMLFESEKEAPLYVKFQLNDITNEMTFHISYNLKFAKTIRDIVETTMICNAFCEGNGFLCGQPLESNLIGDKPQQYHKDSAMFWEKVLQIESALNLTFIPSEEDIDYETACLVEQLYQNIIKGVPTRKSEKIDSLDGKWDLTSEIDIKDSIGKPLFFEFEVTAKIELFGVEFELPSLIGVFNAVLSDYIDNEEKSSIILADESEEKSRYTSTMLFKTEEELKAFRNGDRDKYISSFRNAKKVNEYI